MKIWIIEPEKTSVAVLLKDQITRLARREGIVPPRAATDRLREEKRLYPRISCFLLVDYVAQDCAYRAFVRNVSADGAFIETQRPVPAGPKISLIVSLPDGQGSMKTTGDIVWVGDRGIGVKFDPVEELMPDKPPS